MTTRVRSPFLKNLAASCAVFCSALSLSAPAYALNPNDTSVQMFRWKWNDIASECTNWLGPKGFGAVQVSPPHAAANLGFWYDIYQPVNYTVLNSAMGTQAQFQSMGNTCHPAGVRVYADVVVNHMAPNSGTATDGSTWNGNTMTYPFFSGNDFHANCAIQDADYGSPGNQSAVRNCRLVGLIDLATESTYVRTQVKNYLTKLLNMGVDGFRFDASKHMQPADLQAFVSGVAQTTLAGEPVWVTHEIIPDGNVNRADYFSSGTVNEFKFTYAMRETFRGTNGNQLSQIRAYMGTPGNWGGTWGFVDSPKATVFVNNWDTERSGDSLIASNFTGITNDTQGSKRYDLANIFMLAWPYGHAQLHSGFRFTNKDQTSPSASPFDASGNPLINVNWDFIHRWGNIANMVKFRSTTSGQGVGNFINGTTNQIAFSRGNKGFVAINNEFAAWNATFQTGLPAGTYCNVIVGELNGAGTACTGASVVVDATGQANLSLPANGGSVVPAVALHANQKVSGGGDTQAPSVPTGLTKSNVTSNAATISWAASTDNVGVSLYKVMRNGVQVTTTASTSYTNTGLSAATSYSYTVSAHDAAGNGSAASAPLSVTTLNAPAGCPVTFTIANANTTVGQNLYVVGNQTSIGNWTPASGYALAIQGSGANVPWTGTATLPVNTAIQYKYVKWNGSTAVWESNQATTSGNRQFTTPASCTTPVARNDGNFKF
ncbi:MAG: alpha-amylase Aml [Burkholderiales bacterium PBB4]|nr:MAG: alpha-amylase Aml [Burkholderiales bacterium PBB4]